MALRSPAVSAPTKSQFLRLCGARHNRKNWLFVGDGEAGERGAILYTVVESCRRRGIDPYEYLRDVLERMPGMLDKDLESLTPAGWAAARAKRQTQDLAA
jgi:hypothetical protein